MTEYLLSTFLIFIVIIMLTSVRIRRIRDDINEMPKDFMYELKKWALEGKNYIQVKGTAMGTRMAPSYAHLFMGRLEQEFLRQQQKKPSDGFFSWFRFVDDIFVIWTAGLIALNHRFGCLSDSMSSEATNITQSVEDFHHSTYLLDLQQISFWKYVSTSSYKKFVASMDHLHDVSEEYVKKLESLKDGVNETDCILQSLVSEGSDGRDVAVVMAVDMFLAGVEIVAGMVGTFLYSLSKHPSEQKKLADIVNSQSEEKYKPLVQTFIKETLRLWPVAIGTVRQARQDIVLSGFKIPKGTVMVIANYVMCHDPRYFADPLDFKPSRWLAADKLEFSQYAFAPFGIGSRSCVGRRIAMLEFETFVTKVLKNFVVEYNYGGMEFDSRFLNVIRTPLQFKLSDRMV